MVLLFIIYKFRLKYPCASGLLLPDPYNGISDIEITLIKGILVSKSSVKSSVYHVLEHSAVLSYR
jgi:hypothetical protein